MLHAGEAENMTSALPLFSWYLEQLCNNWPLRQGFLASRPERASGAVRSLPGMLHQPRVTFDQLSPWVKTILVPLFGLLLGSPGHGVAVVVDKDGIRIVHVLREVLRGLQTTASVPNFPLSTGSYLHRCQATHP